MAVNLQPVPFEMRKISPKYWPGVPPIFVEPFDQGDKELARRLFRELDPASQWWYWRNDNGLFSDLGPIPEPQRERD
jgi:hypothetical protein